jgi:hypothetical protein
MTTHRAPHPQDIRLRFRNRELSIVRNGQKATFLLPLLLFATHPQAGSDALKLMYLITAVLAAGFGIALWRLHRASLVLGALTALGFAGVALEQTQRPQDLTWTIWLSIVGLTIYLPAAVYHLWRDRKLLTAAYRQVIAATPRMNPPSRPDDSRRLPVWLGFLLIAAFVAACAAPVAYVVIFRS